MATTATVRKHLKGCAALCPQNPRHRGFTGRRRRAAGRDKDKGRGYGGPNVERQVFGVLLTFFVVLFSFSGASHSLPQSAMCFSSPSGTPSVPLRPSLFGSAQRLAAPPGPKESSCSAPENRPDAEKRPAASHLRARPGGGVAHAAARGRRARHPVAPALRARRRGRSAPRARRGAPRAPRPPPGDPGPARSRGRPGLATMDDDG